MNRPFFIIIVLHLLVLQCQAQLFTVHGRVTCKGKNVPQAAVKLAGAELITPTDSSGLYSFSGIKNGSYLLQVFGLGYDSVAKEIIVAGEDVQKNIHLVANSSLLNNVTVKAAKENTLGITRLKDVDGTAIYAGKKNEVIVIKDMVANTSTNNTRQLYSKVVGLNIWESDVAGIQLGVGGRGLDPKRVTNFNTRQNGYDISADALGYPESYYTPPADMVERIEIVRGAASLQYGTQFGGLINFRLNKGIDTQKLQVISRATGGSWNFLNSSTSVGGTIKKWNYYVFYQHKSGDGWRPNSDFHVNTAYASATYNASEKLAITVQFTFMDYLAHQPGGLTDQQFAEDPQLSTRNRNWFKVNWNLGAVLADYRINDHLKLNTRFFGLDATRSALGILTFINRPDPGGPRDLWTDHYTNWGNETRLLYTYHTRSNPFNLLIGTRFYDGHTDRNQGQSNGNSGSSGNASDFEFHDPSGVNYWKYGFPNVNKSVFAENIFQLTPKLSIIPGLRYEDISTRSNGFYNYVSKDFAGNIIDSGKIPVSNNNHRSFVIGGIGVSYHESSAVQLYANISQNYRSINFSDILLTNFNMRVDSNLQDERGYSADIGARGKLSDVFYYDVSLFYINYANRIGSLLQSDRVTLETYSYRTNIGRSRNIGVESFAEADIWKLIKKERATMKLSVFSNLSFIDARYLGSQQTAYQNKKVELVPGTIFKTGIAFRKKKFAATYQFSYTGKQYTDATNAVITSNAINGLIPAYYVMDISAEYTFNKTFSVYGTINNFTDNKYFTRRADSYPGPGIIPSDGRGYYFTLQVKL